MALVFAICISDSAPSIIRAPPLEETMMRGCFDFQARSMARPIFSPTTDPMLPPMNEKSMAASTTPRFSIVPVPHRTAS